MTPRLFYRLILATFCAIFALQAAPAWAATVSGETVKWFPITLDFDGPQASETDRSPNPFLDFRLNVALTAPSGEITVVPGFFAGNGNGNGTGSVWRARFSPNESGEWSYQASFRQGANVAVSLDDNAGNSANLSGATGRFSVSNRRDNAPGFLSQGRLNYVGEHYLKFDDGGYWIKSGTDSPENLLGFEGFDDTVSQGGINPNFVHDYENHERDWNNNDPLFQSASSGQDSRGLIGALNYLNSVGVNSVYFLPMNLGGDGQDTYPFVGPANNTFNKTHYDISKLHQWNQVFDHAQRKSIFLHIVLSETELANERWLDNGNLGVERKLFFRELTARFGYVLAAKWNLGEESDFSVTALRGQARYLKAIDWSEKPISVHTQPDNFKDYVQIVGDPLFSATSIQYSWQLAGEFVERWRAESTEKGHPWVLDMDENTGGVGPSNINNRRKQILYDVYFSGGQIEWYFAYHPLPLGGDVTAGDFRLRQRVWDFTTYARTFMENELPFWDMEPADNLVTGEAGAFGGAEVFAKHGDIYAVYLPQANRSPAINLSGANGGFTLRWYNPRTGNFEGTSRSLNGGANQALGSPPSSANEDWVALVKRNGYSFATPGPSNDSVVAESVVQVLEPVAPPPIESVNEPVVEPVAAPAIEPVTETAVEPVLDDEELQPDPEIQSETVGEEQEPQTVIASPAESTPPRFMALANPIAIAGETLTFSVVAVDEDGVAPSVTVEADLPSGMQISGFGNGVLDFAWPVPTDQADPVSITVVAIDAVTPTTRVTLDVVIDVRPAAEVVADTDTSILASSDSATVEPPDEIQQETDSSENRPPVFISLSNRTVMVGERLQIPVVAIDPNGFVPAVWSNRLPNGARLEDTGNGTRNLIWVPEPSQLGLHIIELQVQDAIDPSIQSTREWSLEVIDQTIGTAPLFSTSNDDEQINNAPFFVNIEAQTAVVGQEFTLAIRPIDPDGIAPHLQLDNSLDNAQFSDDGNGGRVLSWTPTAEEAGETILRFIATDHDNQALSSILEVRVSVF